MARLLDHHGRPLATAAERELRERMSDLRQHHHAVQGRYDAAQTNDGNARHWANADGYSANHENSPQVCRTLRMRSRYEYANNSYVQGLALTLSNHTIGTGPRLQMQTQDPAVNQYVERLWSQWMSAVRLAPKLRVMVLSRFIDGAGLAIKTTNPKVPHVCKMDVRIRDYDRLETPDLWGPTKTAISGITFDAYGNPIEYHLLKDHPGSDLVTALSPNEYDKIPARHVCHWFRSFRPEQDRGRPELAPALPLFAQLRRYTLAVLRAAELAAEIAGVIRTNGSAVDPDEVEAMDALEIEMGHLLTLPLGWDISTLKSEQPVTTYGMFKEELLVEAGRSVNAHRGIMLGDHSRYNYASGRLDKQNWHTMLELDRQDCELMVLESLLGDFLAELGLMGMLPDTPAMARQFAPPSVPRLQAAAGYLDILGRGQVASWLRGTADTSPGLSQLVLAMRDLKAGGYEDESLAVLSIPHSWGWDGQKHVDRAKEANGQRLELANGTTTRRREMMLANIDMDQADEEAAAGYGITVPEYRQRLLDVHFPQPVAPAAADASGTPGKPQKPQSVPVKAIADNSQGSEDDADDIAAAWLDADAETQARINDLLGV